MNQWFISRRSSTSERTVALAVAHAFRSIQSLMAGDWRISPEERLKYDSFFQQCGPVQGFLSGEQARDFFIKSNLPPDVLRKIWDLADVTVDGRLDQREFAIACHLIASQVQKKGPLPATLPPSLLTDFSIPSNGVPPVMSMPTTNLPSQPMALASSLGLLSKAPMPTATAPMTPVLPALTAAIRAKFMQQFHSLVDVTKTNGYMTGFQAKNILQQTGLSHVVLHHIWNLADHDKDGRLTAEEFIVAMHCCDIVRAGQTLPMALPDDWFAISQTPPKSTTPLNFAHANPPLKESVSQTPPPTENNENEQKLTQITYEEKRLKNYEEGNRELERRRQLLREQEEREQREREERERKRELELQKQKEEQERRKQQEIERQLEKQRQIEQQKEEERRKLFEQREAARKELERKNRLEWERQRMQELSSQKSRLLEQISDLKSREKAMEFELQSMDDTMQTCQAKIEQTNSIVHSTEESLADLQRNIESERNLLENFETQKKDLLLRSTNLQSERESLESSLNEIHQSIEFSKNNREADQVKLVESQVETMKDETTQIEEQINQLNIQSKQCQEQIEELQKQFHQLEQEARAKKPPSVVNSPSTTTPSTSFANFDQFNAQPSVPSPVQASAPVLSESFPSLPVLDVDPFQTVDPFACQPDLTEQTNNENWFNPPPVAEPDPFLPKTQPAVTTPAAVASPKVKKPAPKVQTSVKTEAPVDPWGASTTTTTTNNNGHNWTPFEEKNTSSPFDTQTEWPSSSSALLQYRALFDYVAERPDEMGIVAGDIITVDPSKQQDEHWLFGQIGHDRQGFFPAAYTELVTSGSTVTSPTSAEPPTVDPTSQLQTGSLVIALADLQGKTPDKHLSFKKGETIVVRSQKDATWYSGQLHGKVGWFPRNYVRPATEVELQNAKNSAKNTPTSEKSLGSPLATNGSSSMHELSAEIYEAIYAYEATDPSDLSFDVGEKIMVLKRDGDWWTGQIGDRTGTFPYNYVQKVDHTNGFTETTTPHNDESHPGPKSDELRYIAIFPYEAQQEDELSFPADAILEILDQTGTTGWFKAKLGDRVGLIPSTYVQAMDPSATSVSTPSCLSPTIILSTPSKSESPPYPYIDDSNVVANVEESPPSVTCMDSSHQSLNNSARVAAIRELVETEQRYVHDLKTVADDFIKPLSYGRILNDQEIDRLFSNWFSLIAFNSVFLTTLQEQVQYKDLSTTDPEEDDATTHTVRSVSLSNIAKLAQVPIKSLGDSRPVSYAPEASQIHFSYSFVSPFSTLPRQTSIHALSKKRWKSPELQQDNIVPRSTLSMSVMTITEATTIGDILCSYIPYMADAYFQYCNCSSRANKYLQSKIELNEQFRAQLDLFQEKTNGLSLNGFLTKPIQRVTRYPLLIEKILKHTPTDHPDYQSVRKAFESARELTERINQKISEQENSVRLDWLQQHLQFGSDEHCSDGYIFDEEIKFNSKTRFHKQRRLLLHGLLIKIPSGKELLAFLFNDFLLLSTIKTASNNWRASLFESKTSLQLKLYRMPIILTDIISATEQFTDQFTFTITTKTQEKPLILKAQQTNLRTLWVRAITNAIEDVQKADRPVVLMTESTSDTRKPVARLVIVVQEAFDLPLTTTGAEQRRKHLFIDPYCEITINGTTQRTSFAKRTNQPRWNSPMEFVLYDLKEDIIHVNLFDHQFFSPNENLGYISVQLTDILPCPLDTYLKQSSFPFTQRIYLNTGASVVVKCVLNCL